MAYYRDIGYVSGGSATRQSINTIKHTQVYEATHDGADNRLPFMNRSFISFTYGGKAIEDFNLIAVIDGNRLTHGIYADFVSNVTDSNVFDGQIYWSTHFKANTWELTLATDGMTEQQLDSFKNWFYPGALRELILSEHPNRAAIARIAQLPSYSVIPFEERKEIVIQSTTYTTSTTIYKGTIGLTFVMDDPFWYSVSNILTASTDASQWVDANGQLVSPIESEDALKIILEDNVPTLEMVQNANNLLFGTGHIRAQSDDNSIYGSLVEYATADISHVTYNFNSEDTDITVGDSSNPGFFFYGGNAPCNPMLRFTITPKIYEGYIVSPCSTFGATSSTNGNFFNTITFESQEKYTFKFTTPGIFTGYNQVINILKNIPENSTWEDVKILIRDNVKHYVPRAYAIAVIEANKGQDILANNTTTITVMINAMAGLFKSADETVAANLMPITFIIDNQFGQAIARVSYHETIESNSEIITIEEKVGDMMLSKYLFFKDRNYFTTDGEVAAWTAMTPQNSYRIYTDVEDGLTNFNMEYKYLYL